MGEQEKKITDVKVAYFSAEFGIRAELPIYSGGLGILAGDHIKAANDLGLPLVGVGLFYRRGYFQQRIRTDGVQEVIYPHLHPSEMGLELVTDVSGKPVHISVPIDRRWIKIQAWCVHVGNVPIYLLDSDVETNAEKDRYLTDQLYGGDREKRLCQEMILGMGGVRLLTALGIVPGVWHLNEGHVAFLALQRLLDVMRKGVSFETAREVVKANTLFTTHTPVAAGHDVFALDLLDHCFAGFYREFALEKGQEQDPRIRDMIIDLGRDCGHFNMTRLAMRMASKVNGVSQLHAMVTKELFHRWTPHLPAQDISVEAVTNGIHTRTWLAPEMKALFDMYFDSGWLERVDDEAVWGPGLTIPAEPLWETHQKIKERMIARFALPIAKDTLVIGFARRFATYKRADLLFQDLKRLERILFDSERPVCFVFAGKAHPADQEGQRLLRQIIEWSRHARFGKRIFFIEDYDFSIAQALVQGVDVWLNTPLKPMEASGTSGQKAAVNGVINCSILDGWWDEGYNGQNGWSVNGAQDHSRDAIDQRDREDFYRVLEEQIIPLYYDRDTRGIPGGWTDVMKSSIRSLAPVFNTRRMVREYAERFYLPLARRGQRFQSDAFDVARRVAAYKEFIEAHWGVVRIHSLTLTEQPELRVQVTVELGPIWENDLRVEVVGLDGLGGIWREELHRTQVLGIGIAVYEAVMPFTIERWRQMNANVRVFPISPDFAHDFELELSTWYS